MSVLDLFGFRCVLHPQAGMIKVCRHVKVDLAPPWLATEEAIICQACNVAKAPSSDEPPPILVRLFPTCVVCLREGWGLTVTGILKNLRKETP